MKLVTITMQLGFDNLDSDIDFSNKEDIANYINNQLYECPEFFGDFGPENIEKVEDID